jgi:hypothetical protein
VKELLSLSLSLLMERWESSSHILFSAYGGLNTNLLLELLDHFNERNFSFRFSFIHSFWVGWESWRAGGSVVWFLFMVQASIKSVDALKSES